MKRIGTLFVFLLLAVLMAGCLPRGQALLPNVPTRAAVEAASEMRLTVATDTQVYAGPGRAYAALQEVAADTSLLLQGQLADGSWLAVAAPPGSAGGLAWIAAEDVLLEAGAAGVPVLGAPVAAVTAH